MEKPWGKWGKRNNKNKNNFQGIKKTVAVIYDFVYDYKLVK